jgi:hemerythrin-like domain-containing protein
MQAHALRVIQDEHMAVAAMLRSLTMLLRIAREQNGAPPFDVLRAMLFYLDEFPERLHHRKESELLFPKVRQRCPDLTDTIALLDRDHGLGESSIRELEHRLVAWEMMGDSRREAFEQPCERFVDNYLRHMALEDSRILPAAREHLTPADWVELDAAFDANRDPLTGHPASEEYRPLFRMIVNTAPSPVGLG